MLSSTTAANTKKTLYIARQIKPTFRSNLNLLLAITTYNKINVENKDAELYTRPSELIFTEWSPATFGKNIDLMNHGSPRHNNTSKMLDPIELLIPIVPCPENGKNVYILFCNSFCFSLLKCGDNLNYEKHKTIRQYLSEIFKEFKLSFKNIVLFNFFSTGFARFSIFFQT